MGPECAIFVEHFAKKITQKKNQNLPDVMRVVRTDIIFAVPKATLIAIRGTRGSLYQKKTNKDDDVDYNVVALDCKDGFLNYTLRTCSTKGEENRTSQKSAVLVYL